MVSGSLTQIESAYDGMNLITNATFNAINIKSLRVYDDYLDNSSLLTLPICNGC